MTPREIRRRGFAWPPPGVAGSAYPTDSRGRVDLELVLEDLRRSRARVRREQAAARELSGPASRVSHEDLDDLQAGRMRLGSRAGQIEAAIDQVERLLAQLRTEGTRTRRLHRLLLGVYLGAALVGLVVHWDALGSRPRELPHLEWSAGLTRETAATEMGSVRAEVYERRPAAAHWLAPSALFWFEDRAGNLLAPDRWILENATLAERVARVNACIDEIPPEYEGAAQLMVAIFGAGLLVGLLAAWRPGLGLALGLCLLPCLATELATGPLLGVASELLFRWTLPMLLPASVLLLLQIRRTMQAGLAGPAGDDWRLVWVGGGVFVVGAGVTTAGILLLVELPGAGVLVTAVAPALYGLYLLGCGLLGLIRHRRR